MDTKDEAVNMTDITGEDYSETASPHSHVPLTDQNASMQLAPTPATDGTLPEQNAVGSEVNETTDHTAEVGGDRDVHADLATLEKIARRAFALAEDEKLKHEQDAAGLQMYISALAAECASHAARADALAVASGTASERAQDLDSARAQWADRAVTAEAERDDLVAKFTALKAEKTSIEEALASATKSSAEDSSALAAAETRIAELVAFRTGAESRFASSAAETEALIRQNRDRDIDMDANAARLSFLEQDRIQMSADLAETRSQLDILVESHARDMQQAQARVKKLEESNDYTKQRSALAEEQVGILERQIVDLQSDRERTRQDCQREIDNLNAQLDIHRESARDADNSIREYKEVIAGMSAAMKASEKRAITSGGLGAHADLLLRQVQAELDARLDELENQQKNFELACANERKMAITIEGLKRERDSAVVAAKTAEDRASCAESELEELHRRNDRLERRLMLAAKQVTRQALPPAYTPVQITDLGPVDAISRSPDRMTIEAPSGYSIDDTLAEVEAARQRHDDLIATIARQRDLYRSMLS